jgi:DNA-binding Lrp family transcriptional regulator
MPNAPTDDEVIEAVRELRDRDGAVSYRGLADHLGTSLGTVANRVTALVESGRLLQSNVPGSLRLPPATAGRRGRNRTPAGS